MHAAIGFVQPCHRNEMNFAAFYKSFIATIELLKTRENLFITVMYLYTE